MSTVKGFNIQVKNDDRKLTITNTLKSGGVTFQLNGSTTLHYGFEGILSDCTNEITITEQDFIRLVNVLKNAQEKLQEQNKKTPIQKVVITDETQQKPKKTTSKAKKTTKKGVK